jgi:hypothetical protein
MTQRAVKQKLGPALLHQSGTPPQFPEGQFPGDRSEHHRAYNYRMNPPGETPAGYPERYAYRREGIGSDSLGSDGRGR